MFNRIYLDLVAHELLPKLDASLLLTWLHDLDSLGYKFPPLLKHKPYVYLIQGASRHDVPNLEATAKSDLFFLTFYQENGDIFLPKSTFNEGRNALLRHALAMEQAPGYEYFIFVDDDIILKNVNNTKFFWREDMEQNPWRRFEDFLQQYTPSIGFGQYKNWKQMPDSHITGPVSLTMTADDAMNAYKRDALNFLLPLVETPLDALSFWDQEWIKYFLMKVFYSRSCLQCNAVMTVNSRLISRF